MSNLENADFGMMTAAAIGLHEMYTSLIDAGFTPDQAMTLVVETLRSMAK